MIPLKYLSNFWRTFKMPLINCEFTLDLNWSKNCVIATTDVVSEIATSSIIDTKLYVPLVTLSTQDNAKLHEQLILFNMDERGGGGEGKKPPPSSFSSVNSANVASSSQSFLTISFNPFVTLV